MRNLEIGCHDELNHIERSRRLCFDLTMFLFIVPLHEEAYRVGVFRDIAAVKPRVKKTIFEFPVPGI